MRRRRSVKIIATLGPVSSTPDMIQALFEAGADVFRLNMSHGVHADVAARHAAIRQVEKQVGRPIGILADLQGPKLRVGTFADGPVLLPHGGRFRLDLDPAPGDLTRVTLPHPEIFKALQKGSTLLLNDGKIRLSVLRCGEDFADVRVDVGGELSDRKGVNVPDVILPIPALTEKDRRDLDFALSLGVDWVALSFVQRPADMAEARKLVGGRAAVLAKIEKPAALQTLDEIIELSDAVMVARGDLGVELPLEDVPGVQKHIIRQARAAGKAVVVATQMLESMIQAPVPTRAEVSDVANAVYDSADAVMLSAESAAGAWPVEAVSVMNRIAEKAESDPNYLAGRDRRFALPEATSADAISAAARQVAETLNAAAIICYTVSGSTGARASRERPRAPILAYTTKVETARRLALFWDIHAVVTQDAHDFHDLSERAAAIAYQEGFAAPGERVVITAGVPFGTPGATNTLHVATVPPQKQPPARARVKRAKG